MDYETLCRELEVEPLSIDEFFRRSVIRHRRMKELEKQSEEDVKDLEAFVRLMEARRR